MKHLGLILTAAVAALSATTAAADGPDPVVRRRAAPAPVSALPLAPSAQGSALRVDLSTTGARRLDLPRGKSAIVELPVDARDLLVTNPAVADAVLRSPRRIFILGTGIGQTDAVFFDASGRRILALDIRVNQDGAALADTINRVLPGARVSVEPLGEGVILSGQVANPVDSDRANLIATRMVGKPENVLNMISIAGKDQVMLKVRIVEVQRNIIKQLGFNTSAVLGQLGEAQYLISNAGRFAVNGGLVGGLSGGYQLDTTKQPQVKVPCVGPGWLPGSLCDIVDRDSDVAVPRDTAGSPGLNKAQATLQAFERVGLVRTLAEPNLTTVSGEAARFLAGGEFPIPVNQDDNGRVTVDYKPFGVGLGFTPVVMSGGRISLKMSTEVSELTSVGAFSVTSGTNGPALSVPGLNVRRAETTVELPSGGSMMIAGLLREETRQNLDSLPGMMQLPVLGGLFRSRDYLKGETELVILVTPYIVGPAGSELQTPADGLQIASDPETVLLGRLNKLIKPPAQPDGQTWKGPIGYVIE
ncbi:type II and III secretion system protein family protein [Caulobacter sp. NIBR2454]|uniref:type II and III secretion system protein family protein n=1 Tax=Caulobacter sp. NIBR2454 TaxID=3015996 RepID=UPI0022B5FDE6|nr:type II and III secretion system protein family protein [Caulobacter sp. NIBR2454]